MPASHFTAKLIFDQPQLKAGAWAEVFSWNPVPSIVEVRKAFKDKYGVELMNAVLSHYEIKKS